MRMLINLVGLLLVLAIVAWLAKGSYTSANRALPASLGHTASQPQSPQQVQQQYKQALDEALKQRPMPADE